MKGLLALTVICLLTTVTFAKDKEEDGSFEGGGSIHNASNMGGGGTIGNEGGEGSTEGGGSIHSSGDGLGGIN